MSDIQWAVILACFTALIIARRELIAFGLMLGVLVGLAIR